MLTLLTSGCYQRCLHLTCHKGLVAPTSSSTINDHNLFSEKVVNTIETSHGQHNQNSCNILQYSCNICMPNFLTSAPVRSGPEISFSLVKVLLFKNHPSGNILDLPHCKHFLFNIILFHRAFKNMS